MIVTLSAIGRFKSGMPEQALTLDWLKRGALQGRAMGFKDVRLLEVDPRLNAPDPVREAEAFLKALVPDTHLILFDEHGSDPGSDGLARLLGGLKDRGVRETAFLIGGADGHGPAVREKADKVLAFGRWTWPHRLVRAMAAEQLYRALTILAGTPYHRV